MIELQRHRHGVVLPVKAQAGANGNGLRGEQQGMLKVSVTQAPEKGKANQAIIAVLAEALHLRKSQIELLSGETAPLKKLLIRDCDVAALRRRIEEALPQ